MEDMSLSGLDNSKLEAIAHEIYTDLVEDACLGLCFEVHRAVKCGYFFLDDTDPDSMKDFGTNNSESRKTKKKKPHLGLVSGGPPGLGSSKKKKPKPPAPHTPSIYDDIN
uniref:Ataxin 7 like 3 n=1 Tax=Calidris pygmaea TaxID=425635 RepID=A0A8C3K086_9CHAR